MRNHMRQTRDIAIAGRLHLTSSSLGWCTISAEEDAVSVTASSLRALFAFISADIGPLGKYTASILKRSRLNLDVRVGATLIARAGPHANTTRLSRLIGRVGRIDSLMGIDNLQINSLNLLRAKLGLHQRSGPKPSEGA